MDFVISTIFVTVLFLKNIKNHWWRIN